jgi:DDE superfamily endonuclease
VNSSTSIYPDAEYVRVVQDNLSIHCAGALYQAFPPAEARRILRRIEFHYTPKHASWLNMVEIEIGGCAASASTAASTTQRGSSAKSLLGSDSETEPGPASDGCSQPIKREPKWPAPIQ